MSTPGNIQPTHPPLITILWITTATIPLHDIVLYPLLSTTACLYPCLIRTISSSQLLPIYLTIVAKYTYPATVIYSHTYFPLLVHVKSAISVLYVSYPLKKAPDRAETSGDPLKSVIG